MTERDTCHDCGAREGELHEPGCDIGLAFDAGSYFAGADADFQNISAEEAEIGDALRGEQEEGGLEFEGFEDHLRWS